MEDLNIKQLTLAVRTIAEEKNLPEETVLEVIEQAIAAAWRRDNGTREQLVRASLNRGICPAGGGGRGGSSAEIGRAHV